MTTPLNERDVSGHPLESVEQSRWGIRLRELASEATTPTLEPVDWKPKPPFWQRLRRGTAVPVAAAAAVFIAVVVFSIATVWLRPHSVEQDPATQGAPALAGAPGAMVSTEATTDSGAPGSGSAAEGGSQQTGAHDTGTGTGGANLSSTSANALYVHVVGEVNQPGVYELEPGSRALAAIEAAGGATAGAVLSGLNLARPLTDGEQLVVPNAAQSQAALVTGPGGTSPNTNSASGGLVSLNSADQSALESLPRVGPSLAQRILEWRSANGGFQSVDQLLNISGIGQKTFEQLSELVTL